MLYLEEVGVYNTVKVDSVKLSKNGRFSFHYNEKMSGFYQLRIPKDKIIVFFPNPGEKIKITADAKDVVSSVEVSGSHDTEQISKLIKMLNETRVRLDSVAVIYDKTEGDTAKEVLKKKYNSILEKHRRASIAYLLTHYNSLSSLYAIYQQYAPNNYVFYKTTDLQYFKILTDSLTKYHPKSPHVAALKSFSNRRLNELKTQMLMGMPGVKVNQLPEIELPDFAGDTVSLASLKGKLVLLTFWVSGSNDCVNNNLELKKIYQKFRSRGFEIFQVSFDNSVEAWQKAVRFDELPWVSVIESGNNSVLAGNYNVTALPANYLIDRDNVSILAKNLTPDQLQAKLQQMN